AIRSSAKQGDGDGEVPRPRALPQELVLDVAVGSLIYRIPSEADAHKVGDAVIETVAHVGIVETKHFVQAAVDLPKPMSEDKLERPLSFLLEGVAVHQTRTLEGLECVVRVLRLSLFEFLHQVILRKRCQGTRNKNKCRYPFHIWSISVINSCSYLLGVFC